MWVKCTNLKFTAPGMFVYLIPVSPLGLWYRTLPTLFSTYDARFPGWYSSSGFSLAVTSSTKTALLLQHLVTTALLCFSFNWSFTCQLFFLDYELLFWRFQMTHVTSCAVLCLCLSIFQVKLYSPTLASSEKPRILCNIHPFLVYTQCLPNFCIRYYVPLCFEVMTLIASFGCWEFHE